MIYAHVSQDLNNVVVGVDTAVFQTRAAEVHLKNSQGDFIDEGSVKYYAGGWREFGITSEGVVSKELLPNSYKFRLTYAFASNDLTQNIGDNSTVVFQTVPTQVQLQDSEGNLMDEGTVKYYSGGWRDFGVTSSGVASKELLPNSYKFRLTYAFASNDLTQNIGDNSTVVFQTVPAQVQLQDSEETLIDEGTVKYYSGGWREFGVTSQGNVYKELLSNNYKFIMTYAFGSNDKTQDIGTEPVVQFSTVLAEIKVTDQQDQPVDNVEVKYYSGGWRILGTTSNGQTEKQLLPLSYKFRITYNGQSQDKTRNLSDNSIVEFQVE